MALENLSSGNTQGFISNLNEAIRQNDAIGQYYMGQCYEYGYFIESNLAAAFQLYRRSAERGFGPAMYELSRCYKEGIGVEKNLSKAKDWQIRYDARKDRSTVPDLMEVYQTVIASNEVCHELPIEKQLEIKSSEQSPRHNDKSNNQPDNDTEIGFKYERKLSYVDIDIPVSKSDHPNSFALIIANENYHDVASVSNAINDGEAMFRYCTQTLGMPTTNVHLLKDATLNNIRREFNRYRQIAEAYNGEASLLIYYAGHGFPDEKSKDAYIVPVDGFPSDMITCISLNEFYSEIGQMSFHKSIIIMDACFSGATRDKNNQMLYAARGIAIKPKKSYPKGSSLVISSCMDDETAYPYEEENHGLFTYFLLKKLKDSCGEISMGGLFEYLKENVIRHSIVINGKSQTPSAIPSDEIGDQWKSWSIN